MVFKCGSQLNALHPYYLGLRRKRYCFCTLARITLPGMNNRGAKLQVGDRVKFLARLGQAEEGVILAVVETPAGTQLNITFGKGLSASVSERLVLKKIPQ
jgi:hypothetical protein